MQMILIMKIILLIFLLTPCLSYSQASNFREDPCEVLEEISLREICEDYTEDERFEVFLTPRLVEACQSQFLKKKGLFDMCIRSSSRDSRMSVEKIGACSKVSFLGMNKKYCLKMGPLLRVSEIKKCYEDSKWFGGVMQCLGYRAAPIPMEFLYRIEAE